MPRHAATSTERATEALRRLEKMGGEATLPEVLAPEDARPLLGERWYDSARMLDALPGVRITGGVWRCDRTTFLNWLREMCNATTN